MERVATKIPEKCKKDNIQHTESWFSPVMTCQEVGV